MSSFVSATIKLIVVVIELGCCSLQFFCLLLFTARASYSLPIVCCLINSLDCWCVFFFFLFLFILFCSTKQRNRAKIQREKKFTIYFILKWFDPKRRKLNEQQQITPTARSKAAIVLEKYGFPNCCNQHLPIA